MTETRKSKVLSLVFALMPILHQYTLTSSGSVTLAILVTLFTVVIVDFKYNRFAYQFDYLEKGFLGLFLGLFFFSLFGFLDSQVFNGNGFFSRIIYSFMYLYFLYIFRRYIDTKSTLDFLLIFSFVSSLVCLIQLFINPEFGFYLPLTRIESEAYVSVGDTFVYRPNGLFGEPSHCAYYLAITVLAALFSNVKITPIKMAILVFIICTCCIITSASATYLLICIAILYLLLKKKSLKLVLGFAFAFCVVLIIINYFKLNDLLLYGLGRFETSSSRIFNGLEYFKSFDWFQSLFGCGIGSYSVITKEKSTFLSGIARILVENGIVGVIILCVFLLYVLNKADRNGKAFVLFFLLLNLFESAFATMYLPLILAWVSVNKDNVELLKKGTVLYGNCSYNQR